MEAAWSLNFATPKSAGEFAVFPMQPLVIDEQADKLGLAQTLMVLALKALFEGFGQGKKAS